MNLLLIALVLGAPPQATLPKQPAQVALPACACKPCHCEDCACAGGICACAGCGLSLEAGAALAARRGLPLVVWVGHHDPASVVLAEMAGDWLRVPVRPTPLYFAPSAGRQC